MSSIVQRISEWHVKQPFVEPASKSFPIREKSLRGNVASTVAYPPPQSKGKSRITIYIDDDILEAYRKEGDELGRGYQTLINEALRESLVKRPTPVDARTIRRIVREEKAG